MAAAPARIEEALLRHPGHYVIADSTPEGFIYLGEDSEFSLQIDGRTGRLYYADRRDYLPDSSAEREAGSHRADNHDHDHSNETTTCAETIAGMRDKQALRNR